MNIRFSNKLKALRALHDMQQKDLCEASGINRNLIVAFERGNAIPGPEQLADLEQVFGIRFNEVTDQAFTTLAPTLAVPVIKNGSGG